jgi:hypothetical protein
MKTSSVGIAARAWGRRDITIAIAIVAVVSVGYERLLLLPIPSEWHSHDVLRLGIIPAALLGALLRGVTRRARVVGPSCAAGLILGAAWAHQRTDVIVPFGQAVLGGIAGMGMYPVWVWGAILLAWFLAGRLIDMRSERLEKCDQ